MLDMVLQLLNLRVLETMLVVILYFLPMQEPIVYMRENTKEFKEEFWRRYQGGDSPREIVEALGYEPDILGTSRLSGLQMNIKKQANRPGGFTEGKNNRKGLKAEMVSVDENPDRDTLVRMQHEILYLRQEVEFLKKITSVRNTGK